MPLTLVTGPANAAKAGTALARYREWLAHDPRLVVPTWADGDHYRRELAATGAVFSGRVVRFNDLASEIAGRAGLPRRVASATQRDRILRAAIARTDLQAFAPASAAPGFARALGRLLSELERSLVDPPRLAAALERWAAGDRGRLRLAGDLAGLHRAYRDALASAGLVDRDVLARRALDALRASPQAWGATPVVVYGFDDLTPVEVALVDALAGPAGAQVLVTLTYEPGRAALRSRARTLEALRPLAGEHIELPDRAEHYAPESRAALHHLERQLFEAQGPFAGAAATGPEPAAPEPLRLFGDPPARVPAGEAVALLEAAGARAEAELVCAEVVREIHAGTPAERIAIVCRRPQAYRALLGQVLGCAGVALATHGASVPLRRTPFGRGVLALLRCAALDGDAGDLLAYLRTPGLLRHPELADELEAELRRDGTLTLDAARARWEARRWRLDAVDRLAGAAREQAGGNPVALLDRLASEVRALLAAPHRREAPLLDESRRADARACAEVVRALRALRELADRDPGLAPTASELAAELAEVGVPCGEPPGPGRVQLAGPLDIRARRYEVVILCGLQEGEFPAVGRPDPFLADERRRELARVAGIDLRLHEDVLDDERALFYACATRAERRLVLSHRTADEEGNPQIPSPFVDDVREILGPDLEHARRTRTLADVVWAQADAPTERERLRAAAAAGPRREPATMPPVHEGAALAALAPGGAISAGALEAMAACPARWLVEKVLCPEPLEPEPEALNRGNLAHAVLRRVMEALRDRRGSARLDAGSLPEALELLGEALEQEGASIRVSPHPARDRAALRRLEVDLRRLLSEEAQSPAPFEPARFEVAFGTHDAQAPALRLPAGEDGAPGVAVCGRVDRIDTAPDGAALVVDYKASRAHPVAAWERDNVLQVPLYLLAARDVLGLDPVGGVYVPVQARDRRPRGLLREDRAPNGRRYVSNDLVDAEDFDAALRSAAQRAVEAAARMRSGRLDPCPSSCTSRGCRYPAICRSEGG